MIGKIFRDHPASVGETYVEHGGRAWRFAARLTLAGVACFLHGIFPLLFQRTGSRTVSLLHEEMVVARVRSSNNGQANPGRSARAADSRQRP